MGWSLLELNRPSEAKVYFQRALRLHDDHLRSLNGFALSLKREGRIGEAIAVCGRPPALSGGRREHRHPGPRLDLLRDPGLSPGGRLFRPDRQEHPTIRGWSTLSTSRSRTSGPWASSPTDARAAARSVTPLQILILVAAAFGAGVMNAMAGGGTILTFPSLIFLGLPAITASATSTVALLPAAVASLYGFRDEVRRNQGWLKTLFLPSLIGGTIGSVLLLRTPEKVFAFLAPLLILFATALFMLQELPLAPRPAERRSGPGSCRAAVGARLAPAVRRRRLRQLFGAGIGILMLALLGFLGLSNIHAANGVKNFFNLCINTIAAGYFIWKGAVVWPAALVIVAGATLGGYAGARFAQRIGRQKARAAVVVIGLGVTAILVWQQMTK